MAERACWAKENIVASVKQGATREKVRAFGRQIVTDIRHSGIKVVTLKEGIGFMNPEAENAWAFGGP
jgi:hypothetical protein